MYVMPSASDESLSIGAALHYYYSMLQNLIEKMAGLKTFIWEVK